MWKGIQSRELSTRCHLYLSDLFLFLSGITVSLAAHHRLFLRGRTQILFIWQASHTARGNSPSSIAGNELSFYSDHPTSQSLSADSPRFIIILPSSSLPCNHGFLHLSPYHSSPSPTFVSSLCWAADILWLLFPFQPLLVERWFKATHLGEIPAAVSHEWALPSRCTLKRNEE